MAAHKVGSFKIVSPLQQVEDMQMLGALGDKALPIDFQSMLD